MARMSDLGLRSTPVLWGVNITLYPPLFATQKAERRAKTEKQIITRTAVQ